MQQIDFAMFLHNMNYPEGNTFCHSISDFITQKRLILENSFQKYRLLNFNKIQTLFSSNETKRKTLGQ